MLTFSRAVRTLRRSAHNLLTHNDKHVANFKKFKWLDNKLFYLDNAGLALLSPVPSFVFEAPALCGPLRRSSHRLPLNQGRCAKANVF